MNKLKKNIEKQAVHVLKITGEQKDVVVNSYLNELNKTIKNQMKRKKLIVYVIEDK